MNSDIKRYLKEVKMIVPLHSKERISINITTKD